MKTVKNKQVQNNPYLELWNKVAAKTRNPIEFAYAILKWRFSLLKTGVELTNEDDVARRSMACLIPHYVCTDNEDNSYENFKNRKKQKRLNLM